MVFSPIFKVKMEVVDRRSRIVVLIRIDDHNLRCCMQSFRLLSQFLGPNAVAAEIVNAPHAHFLSLFPIHCGSKSKKSKKSGKFL